MTLMRRAALTGEVEMAVDRSVHQERWVDRGIGGQQTSCTDAICSD